MIKPEIYKTKVTILAVALSAFNNYLYLCTQLLKKYNKYDV